jgi:glycosyltransferase involved in cell wall biosynthesis
MDRVPSLLMISWNRSEYLIRTVNHLLADPSDFRLYMWDNGSTDATRDFVNELRDDRIVMKELHPENVRQYAPWFWYLENFKGDIGGKLDDDILGQQGWMTCFADLIAEEERFGLLGGWVYQSDEWDEHAAAHKIMTVGRHRIFRNMWVAGCMFQGRLDILRRFSPQKERFWGMPINHRAITEAGYISGYPLPIAFGVNLDDPRHPDCRMNRPGGWDEFAAFTARMRDFSGPQEYGQWIAEDARKVLATSVAQQLRDSRGSLTSRIKGQVNRLLGRD